MCEVVGWIGKSGICGIMNWQLQGMQGVALAAAGNAGSKLGDARIIEQGPWRYGVAGSPPSEEWDDCVGE